MKKTLTLLPFYFLLIACSGSFDEGNTDTALDGPEPSREWQPVWSDEFDGDTLDASKWNYQIGDGRAYVMQGWGNDELQYYTDSPNNVKVEDGHLVITSLADGLPMSEVDPNYGNTNQYYDFTSARITTSEKFEFTYGRVEAKIKMDSSDGLWHAFWLLGSETSPYGGWPQKGEIDIMEAWVHSDLAPQTIGGAAHLGTQGFHQYKSENFEVDYDDGEYHLYAVEWDSEQIRWFVDGKHFYTLTQASYWNYYQDAVNGWQGFVDKNDDGIDDNLDANLYANYLNSSINAPFDNNHYIILNSAVGGTLPDSVGESADPDGPVFLGEMKVDYVRVYQCPEDPLLPEATGCKNYLDTYEADDYYTNSALRPKVPSEQSSFSSMTDLYVNGNNPESILGVPYSFKINENLVLSVVNDAEGSGNLLSIESLGRLNNIIPILSITRDDLDTIIFAGFDVSPSALGDFKFDLYIEDYDPDASNPLMAVGMAESDIKKKFVALPLKDYQLGKWHRITIPVTDILNGSGQKINLQKLSELLFFQFSHQANVKIDNIQFACGAIACGIIDEMPVFIDSVDQLWTRGIRGNDAQQKSTLFENPDYTENDQHHVQWNIFNTGEQGHDYVIETTIGTTRSDTDPLYPSEAVNFIGSENAISAIAALTDGEFRFDIRMMHNPNDVDLYFKVDGSSTSTGEQTLGPLTIGEWKQFNCSIANLKLQGLDVSTITAPFVMVPGINGAGKDVRFQWDNVIFSPVKEGDSPTLNLPIMFSDGGFCLPVAPFSGGSFKLASNPDASAGHSDAEVGKTTKYDYGITWGGITLNLESPIEFGPVNSLVGKLFSLQSFTNRDPSSSYQNPAEDIDGPNQTIGPMRITFKLEAVPGEGTDVERIHTLTSSDSWEQAIFDFNGEGEAKFNGITVIIDDGFRSDGVVSNWTLYFDDIIQGDSNSTIADLSDYPDGSAALYSFDDQLNFLYPDPTGYCGARGSIENDPEGISQRVGKIVYDVNECGKGVTVVGAGNGFANPIPFADGRTTIRLRVYTELAGTEVALKIEDADDADRNAEMLKTTPNAGWSILEFDFSEKSIELSESFEKLMLIFEPSKCVYNEQLAPDCIYQPGADEYYFDDIQLLPGNSP